MLMLRVIGAGGIALVTHVLYLSMDFIYGASVCQKSEDGKYFCLVGQDTDMFYILRLIFLHIHVHFLRHTHMHVF